MKVRTRISLLLATLPIGLSEAVAEPPPAYEGRRLFVSYCQLCHGSRGQGDGPLSRALKIEPADLTTTVRSRSDTILRKIITGEGRQTITGRDRHDVINAAMPAWKDIFDDDQLDSLIAYLRFLSRSRHPLMRDPEHGMKLYQTYCHVCHGVDGDGDGVMTKLIGMRPMDHTNAIQTDALDNQELIRSILDGKGAFMPAWRGILTEDDVESLVSYIRLLSQ